MGAMLLGERSGLEDEQKMLFQTGGISHILAISVCTFHFLENCSTNS